MANEEEKKLPQVYGGQYDQQINDLYGQMSNRPDFQYNVNDDALYKQYRDKYVQNAKRSMKDTMGQATALTGGYGSTYAQGVGQQMYDENMRSLTDVIPELSDRAYQQYKDQGDQILTNFNLANTLGAADQATRQYNQEWDFQQKQYNDAAAQQAYGNLTAAILQSGYVPTEDELKAAGMTSQQANALRQAWIGSNPNLAYMTGAITADQYYQLTGQYAPGTAPAVGGGGYYGGSGSGGKKTQVDLGDTGAKSNVKGLSAVAGVVQNMEQAGANNNQINQYLTAKVSSGALSASDARTIKKDRQVKDRL